MEYAQHRTQLINRCRCSSHSTLRNTASTLVNMMNRVILLPSNRPDPRLPPLPLSFSERVLRASYSDSAYGHRNRTSRTQDVSSSQTYGDKVRASTYTDPYRTNRTYDRTDKFSSVIVPICRCVILRYFAFHFIHYISIFSFIARYSFLHHAFLFTV